jgi:hypothetical protein
MPDIRSGHGRRFNERETRAIVAAIKARDSSTDRYGEDLVFLVVHDLNDREHVHRFMPEHSKGRHLFGQMSEDAQFSIVRRVLDEPEPKTREAAAELLEAIVTEDTRRDSLTALIERIETIVPYVAATIGPGNTFDIEKMRSPFKGTAKDWVAIHRGRASSARNQLASLLKEAQAMKTKFAG